MLLELVRLQGFKSFAKATEVAFCPHFTCITGPNGSGKSNILDAICFALTEDSLQHLRVRSFSELVSTDAEVESGSVALTFSTRAGDDTVKVKLSASVRKEDGSREFKLDGVKKSVKDIRAFLKMEGLDVESKSAILYQNTVMALSEKSGRELAAMVMAASGGSIFDSLVTNANNNIAQSRKQKHAYEASITAFQSDMAADEKQLKLVCERDELTSKVTTSAHAMALAELAQVYREERHANDEVESLKQQRESACDRLKDRDRGSDLTDDQQELKSQLQEANETLSGQTQALNEQQELVAERVEEENDLKSQLEECQQDKEDTKRTLAELLQSKQVMSARQLEAYDEISSNDTELARLQGLLDALKSDSAGDSESHIAGLRSSLADTQAKQDALVAKRRQMEQELSTVSAQLERAQSEHAAQADQKTRSPALDADEMQALRNKSTTLEIQHLQVQQNLQESKARRASLNKKRPKFAPSKDGAMLLQQLDFGEEAEKYLDALSEIAGSKLQSIVVKDVNAAEKMLQRGKVTIWPLDRLQPNISPVEERRVAEAVKECRGHATLPSNVLSFASMPSDVPFRRCFGGWAISKSKAATEHLVGKGIKTCELDGTKHMSGVMAGGYLGGERNNHVRTEYEHQKEERTGQKLSAREAALDAEHEELKHRIQASVEADAAAKQLGELDGQISTCSAQATTCRQQLSEMDREQRLAKERIEMLTAELNDRLSLDETNVRSGLEGRQQHYTQRNEALRSELKDLENKLRQADEDENVLSETLNQNESGTREAELERAIRKKQKSLRSLQRKKERLSADVDTCTAQVSELQQSIETAKLRAAENDQQHQSDSQLLSQIDDSVASKTERLEELKANRAKLITAHHFSESEQQDAANDEAEKVNVPELRISVKVWKQKLSAIQKELKAYPDGTDISALTRKQTQLNEFTGKRDTIDSGIAKLADGIASAQHKKNEANTKAFSAIAASFAELFSQLVPSKEAELRIGSAGASAPGDDAMDEEQPAAIEEVHFAVRTLSQSGSGAHEWKTSTTELSGGQRTLLGLAFVLSIARYQPSPVYILDEVDAALDEGNQARVASLVAQVLGQQQRCQTIAISHHADFQRGAARVVEIAKHKSGSGVANCFDRVPSA